MSGTQLSFSLRLSSGVKTVHLLGSWDNYVGQLPLSKDKTASKGTWKGTFRFSNSALPPGQRYWYYYIIDGYHIAHNPSEASTVEPTTGRSLNILDVGTKSSKDKSSSSKSKDKHSSSKDKHHSSSKKHHSSSHTRDIPKGRPLSTSQIKQPKPVSPHATKHILEADYLDEDELAELAERFGIARIDDDDEEYITTEFSTSGSPVSSESDLSASDSDLSYRSDNSSPNSSMSGYSTPNSELSQCTCQRYGITRKGERVKMDCGGSRCGYSDSSDSCSSGDEDELSHSSHSARRNGVVVRR